MNKLDIKSVTKMLTIYFESRLSIDNFVIYDEVHFLLTDTLIIKFFHEVKTI